MFCLLSFCNTKKCIKLGKMKLPPYVTEYKIQILLLFRPILLNQIRQVKDETGTKLL